MRNDSIIIGGGIIGLATALELARCGLRVTLLERDQVGRESSWAGGGILFPLLPWDYREPVTVLAAFSESLFQDWAESLAAETGIDPEFKRCGMALLPPFDESAALAWCRARDYPAERIAAASRLPWISGGLPALWLPQVSQVRNPRLLKALRAKAEAMGVRVEERAEVTGWESSGQRIRAVATPRGEYAADSYVVCAGAWSRPVLGKHGADLAIEPVRGQMLLFKGEPGALPCIVLQNGTYLIPRRDGHVLAGSTLERVGYDSGVTTEALGRLLARSRAMFPQLTSDRLVRQWAGLRPGSPDNIPTLARHPLLENLYLNGGHFRYGVTMAPGSARLLANLLLGREQPLDMTPYGWPSRASATPRVVV
ncbi:MAG: glycine oxidase ThiO [Betaproteobacteria bacterium]|nr:glycine oxidase ThiO [Betaproteobacteria bacterium]